MRLSHTYSCRAACYVETPVAGCGLCLRIPKVRMIRRLIVLTALLFSMLLFPRVLSAAPNATVASPDGSLTVDIATDPDGRPSYAVSRRGKPIIAPSRLGFILIDAPKFERNITIANPRTRSFDERWE